MGVLENIFEVDSALTHIACSRARYCVLENTFKVDCVHTYRTNTEVVWRTISDFQKDPYTTGLSIFSKITDKILFRSVQNQVKL